MLRAACTGAGRYRRDRLLGGTHSGGGVAQAAAATISRRAAAVAGGGPAAGGRSGPVGHHHPGPARGCRVRLVPGESIAWHDEC